MSTSLNNGAAEESIPLLSVCIVTYNHEKYIRQCLDSALAQQTNFPFEIIIGEDCSKDATRAIIQEFEQHYPETIVPIYHDRNVGAARNNFEFVFGKARGKYLAILDGDDYWTDHQKLQKQVDYLEAHPETSFCFHRSDSVDDDGKLIETGVRSEAITVHNWKDVFHIFIPTLSVVCRNHFASIPPEMLVTKSGDAFIFAILSGYGNAADLGFVGSAYRVHGGGTYSSKSQVDRFIQTIENRKLMRSASCFSELQKRELTIEIKKRKSTYTKQFIKKGQIINALKIILT
ncbi:MULTISPECIES: glycosyltransferase family 2 protein [unclassified Paraflavitalea]|uniref:glycosyltransferase family 2 protein n=1 Tax=unclassified Paraflavitalea TaxID=2798305 RepID=UPI003D3449DD